MRFSCAFVFLLSCLLPSLASTQAPTQAFADSVRRAYGVPELGYAVVSADSVLEWAVIGQQRAEGDYPAQWDDRFHIGSNTKALTAVLAADLVQAGKLKFETKFFEVFPEMKKDARKVYHDITLEDLLSMRAPLNKYIYFSETPRREDLTGDMAAQRTQFVAYFLKQEPAPVDESGLSFSNVSYVMAGMMLERASGQSYQDLVFEFNRKHNMGFGFGFPNNMLRLQPWGHDEAGRQVEPGDFYKLEWLLAAGNTNLRVLDGAYWLQFFLRGHQGRVAGWEAATFEHLLYGKPEFSLGWFHGVDSLTQHRHAHNLGNPGAFISRFVVITEIDRAYLIFCNSFAQPTYTAADALLTELQRRYGH